MARHGQLEWTIDREKVIFHEIGKSREFDIGFSSKPVAIEWLQSRGWEICGSIPSVIDALTTNGQPQNSVVTAEVIYFKYTNPKIIYAIARPVDNGYEFWILHSGEIRSFNDMPSLLIIVGQEKWRMSGIDSGMFYFLKNMD
jgi:hypothetical protein